MSSQKFEFQAEIRQLLDIVVHSLYTEKDIFVRELVSNASDALEKLRHLMVTEKEVADEGRALEVSLSVDEKVREIVIEDSGVGMTREELVENLGTIAHSGSKAFLKALGAEGKKNANLIGQFGVGFYSAFMVAKRVRVFSRSWKKEEKGWCWSSDGAGSYELEEAPDAKRGCRIVVELKEDCEEFAKEWRVQGILEKYSAFVSFPVLLNGKKVNTVQALWLRSKSEVTEEEYLEFYKFQGHAAEAPLFRLHFSADAPLQINALLFVPRENLERFGFMRLEASVALYCRKVLIDGKPKELLPEWLRFLKGVVDSEDLPLNISRESMQDSALLGKLNRVITKRFLKALEEEAAGNAENYEKIWREFGVFLKEGAAMDFTHRESLMKLLRFESTATEAGKLTSLADYLGRMREGQKEVYYLSGASREMIEKAPYLEGLKARGFEVLFCTEAVDEYVMGNVREFEGKSLVAGDGDVKLGEAPSAQGEKLNAEELEELVKWTKEVLGDKVAEVNGSERLVESPALAVGLDGITPQMRRIMKAMKREEADEKLRVRLELNPAHPVIRHLAELRGKSPEKAGLVAEQILDNALISAGLLEDASGMVARLYKLLEEA